MSRGIQANMSVGEIILRVQRETAKSMRGESRESQARLDVRRENAAELREKMKTLRAEANQFAADAAAVEQPHTFFGKLFDGGSSAAEAEEKAHKSEEKNLQAESTKVELEKEQHDVKNEIQKMQTEMQRHDTTMTDLNRMLEQSNAHKLSLY